MLKIRLAEALSLSKKSYPAIPLAAFGNTNHMGLLNKFEKQITPTAPIEGGGVEGAEHSG